MGSNQSKQIAKTTSKIIAKTAISSLASGALITATGGLAAVLIGGFVFTEGYLIKKIGEEQNSETIKFIGDIVFDTGMGAATGGLLGKGSSSLISQGTKKIGKQVSKEIAVNGGKITEKALFLISSGKTISELSEELRTIYSIYGKCSNAYETCSQAFHGKHLDQNQEYHSDCPVCKNEG
jgi:hypothetical protein